MPSGLVCLVVWCAWWSGVPSGLLCSRKHMLWSCFSSIDIWCVFFFLFVSDAPCSVKGRVCFDTRLGRCTVVNSTMICSMEKGR